MTKTVLLTCRPERYQQLAAEVSAWTFDRSAEGWTVRVLQTSAVSGYGLRADLAVQPAFDHLFLLGNLPTIWVTLNPDGHGAHLMPARSFLSNKNVGIDNARDGATDNCGLSSVITKAYAHVGQLNFDGLAGFTEDQITEQYKRWFARRHDLTVNGFKAFTIQSTLHNYFGDSFGPWTIAQFAKFSKSLKYVQIIDDGLLAKQEAALASGIFTGGENYGDGQFLWFVGKYVDLIRMPPQSAIFHCFGSHMGETYTAGSMVRAALVDSPGTGFKDCKVVASIYNHGGRFSFSTLLDGGTGGEAATATEQSIGFPFDYWNGDPTITLDADTLARLAANEQGAEVTEAEFNAAMASIQAQYDELKGRVVALEGNTTTVPPPPGTNYALASNGGVASASSTINPRFPATAINNGDRKGLNWGSGGGWNSGVLGRFPEWIEIDLPTVKAVNRVVVFTVQDDFAHPIEPTDALTFTKYGVQDFEVHAFISSAWQVVATVTGNSLVKRSAAFAAVTAAKWRLNITKAADGYCRVVEMEIYGP